MQRGLSLARLAFSLTFDTGMADDMDEMQRVIRFLRNARIDVHV